MSPIMSPDITQLAADKARVKHLMLHLLAELPDQTAQADVVADINFMVSTGDVPTSGSQKVRKKKSKPAKAVAPTKSGKATKGLRPGTNATKLHTFLKSHPHAPFVEMANAVYGTDGAKAIRGIRAIITSLSDQGLVKSAAYGKWEVT